MLSKIQEIETQNLQQIFLSLSKPILKIKISKFLFKCTEKLIRIFDAMPQLLTRENLPNRPMFDKNQKSRAIEDETSQNTYFFLLIKFISSLRQLTRNQQFPHQNLPERINQLMNVELNSSINIKEMASTKTEGEYSYYDLTQEKKNRNLRGNEERKHNHKKSSNRKQQKRVQELKQKRQSQSWNSKIISQLPTDQTLDFETPLRTKKYQNGKTKREEKALSEN